MDYSQSSKTAAIPQTLSMIEILKVSIIVDIIDNSISADLRNVWIEFSGKGPYELKSQ